jgi:hypothetical protein
MSCNFEPLHRARAAMSTGDYAALPSPNDMTMAILPI